MNSMKKITCPSSQRVAFAACRQRASGWSWVVRAPQVPSLLRRDLKKDTLSVGGSSHAASARPTQRLFLACLLGGLLNRWWNTWHIMTPNPLNPSKSIQIHPNPCTKFLHDIARLRSNYSPGQVRSLQVMRGRPKPRRHENRASKDIVVSNICWFIEWYWILHDIA